MPRIIRAIDPTVGHCWVPTLPNQTSQTVFINGVGIVRVGDPYFDHPLSCTVPPSTHPVIPSDGSRTVFVEGIGVTRQGDPLGCGDTAGGPPPDTPTVFAEGP